MLYWVVCREFFTHMETSPLLWRTANFVLCSALMAIEQWRFFCVPHLLWHGASFNNDRGPLTPTPIAKRLAVELPLPVFTTVAAGIRTPNLQLTGRKLLSAINISVTGIRINDCTYAKRTLLSAANFFNAKRFKMFPSKCW